MLTPIIDSFEIFVESPSSLMARAQFYSQYKRHCTIKVLISCTRLRAIKYISKCYWGRALDIPLSFPVRHLVDTCVVHVFIFLSFNEDATLIR